MTSQEQDGWGDLATSPLGTLKEHYDVPCACCGEPVMHNWTGWVDTAYRDDGAYIFLTPFLNNADLLGLHLLTRHGWYVEVSGDRCEEDEDGFIAVYIQRDQTDQSGVE